MLTLRQAFLDDRGRGKIIATRPCTAAEAGRLIADERAMGSTVLFANNREHIVTHDGGDDFGFIITGSPEETGDAMGYAQAFMHIRLHTPRAYHPLMRTDSHA